MNTVNNQWDTLHATVNGTLGQFPGFPHLRAMESLMDGVREDFGEVSTAHVQVCPQNQGVVTDATVGALKALSPNTQYRLHANVSLNVKGDKIQDLSTARHNTAYYQEAGRVTTAFGSDVYSLHAGRRANYEGGKIEGLHYLRDLEDIMGCTVAVEGHYPTPNDMWMLSSWDEYRWLLESGLSYALDVSHLNIVAIKGGGADMGLTRELLESPNMVELHLSHNNGQSDAHVPMRGCDTPWWVQLLGSANPDAVVFTEGNEVNRGTRLASLNRAINRKPRLLNQ